MAKGYKRTAYQTAVEVDVPTLNGTNTFSGTQTFCGTSNPTDINSGGVVIVAGGVGVSDRVCAGAVYNAVWNDLADCIDVPEDTVMEPGYAYCFDGERYYKSTKYLDDGFVGIYTDTAGFTMGVNPDPDANLLKAGVAGFILVYVDKEYPVGTPLTITDSGFLTKIKNEDVPENSEKIVGTFWKPEPKEKWGPYGKEIVVNGRHWIKIR